MTQIPVAMTAISRLIRFSVWTEESDPLIERMNTSIASTYVARKAIGLSTHRPEPDKIERAWKRDTPN